MEVGALYQVVLVIVLVGMLVGVGVLVQDKFGQTSGITGPAQQAINASRDATGEIATTWMGLIVTIAVMAIILTLVIRSFQIRERRE
jgi:preprotein translocase subunit SecG